MNKALLLYICTLLYVPWSRSVTVTTITIIYNNSYNRNNNIHKIIPSDNDNFYLLVFYKFLCICSILFYHTLDIFYHDTVRLGFLSYLYFFFRCVQKNADIPINNNSRCNVFELTGALTIHRKHISDKHFVRRTYRNKKSNNMQSLENRLYSMKTNRTAVSLATF